MLALQASIPAITPLARAAWVLENVTVVRTSQEFFDAVRAGHPHIELQDHMFFTAPKLNRLGIIPDTVQSIRVRSTPQC